MHSLRSIACLRYPHGGTGAGWFYTRRAIIARRLGRARWHLALPFFLRGRVHTNAPGSSPTRITCDPPTVRPAFL